MIVNPCTDREFLVKTCTKNKLFVEVRRESEFEERIVLVRHRIHQFPQRRFAIQILRFAALSTQLCLCKRRVNPLRGDCLFIASQDSPCVIQQLRNGDVCRCLHMNEIFPLKSWSLDAALDHNAVLDWFASQSRHKFLKGEHFPSARHVNLSSLALGQRGEFWSVFYDSLIEKMYK